MIPLEHKLYRIHPAGYDDPNRFPPGAEMKPMYAYVVAPDLQTAEHIGRSRDFVAKDVRELPGSVSISDKVKNPNNLREPRFAFNEAESIRFGRWGWLVMDGGMGSMRIYSSPLERPLGEEARLPQTNQIYLSEASIQHAWSCAQFP
jgi:hypothetical protein